MTPRREYFLRELPLRGMAERTVGSPHAKPRAFLLTVYGAGLRLNEACHLKPEHLDSARMQIRVLLGKGAKDRYTLLPPRLLEELRSYWRTCRPQVWLFPSRHDPEQPLPTGTGQKMFWRALERAGLPARAAFTACVNLPRS